MKQRWANQILEPTEKPTPPGLPLTGEELSFPPDKGGLRGVWVRRFKRFAVPVHSFLVYAFLAFAAMAFVPVSVARAEPAPVKIDVFAQHIGGKFSYHYRVFNKSQQDISAISVGLDNKNDENPNNDSYELYELPSGWNVKSGIPSTNFNAPAGWRVNLTDRAASGTHAITWEPLTEKSPKLLAGQTLVKMSVALDKPDTNYLTGHARVTFAAGNPTYRTVPLESLDTTPPTLIVNLTPNLLHIPDKPESPSENPYRNPYENPDKSPDTIRRALPVKATFTVKDDYDRMPEIKLESITASESFDHDDIRDATLGADDRYLLLRAAHNGDAERIYTVTYSATDASGNRTTASATVTATTATPPSSPAAASAPVATPTVSPHNPGEKTKPAQ